MSIDGKALFVGGSDADPCPPSADCAVSAVAPLRDGAVFDPGPRRWKRIADAPVGFSFAESVVVGGTAYLLVPGEPGRPGAPAAFLRYRSADDRWDRLARPPDAQRRGLVATDEQVVAYANTDEGGQIPDVVFDPSIGEWTRLPDDPLPKSFDRSLAWDGRELVLFAQELVPQPGSREPSVVIAAAFDPDRGTWRRLPDSEILGSGARWFAHAGRLIFPALGSADGGEVGNWGRPYPNGGILDVDEGRWLPLPDPPGGENEFGAGVVAGEQADVFGETGWILDAVKEDWIPVPPLHGDDVMVTGDSVTAAGRDMIVFGGVRWRDGAQAELLAAAWIYSVP
ncbi:MAG TPA: hypothetical protein VFX51_16395 [Solirubrobacteraceae bacterium]|nr:hypothetical protein [Solirubrobacteraceae bacterium]